MGTSNICPDYVRQINQLGKEVYLQRLDQTNAILNNRLNSECTEEERAKLKETENFTVFQTVQRMLACTDNLDKRRILEDILINKLKYSKTEDENNIYNRAILKAYEATTNEIKLLVFIEYFSTIICSKIDGTGAIDRIDILNEYFYNSASFSLEEINKCIYNGLIYNTFPQEFDLSLLNSSPKECNFISLIDFVKEVLSTHKKAKVNLLAYTLSSAGRIIAKTQIKSLGVEYVAQNQFPRVYSDLIVANLFSKGGISALNDITIFNTDFDEDQSGKENIS